MKKKLSRRIWWPLATGAKWVILSDHILSGVYIDSGGTSAQLVLDFLTAVGGDTAGYLFTLRLETVRSVGRRKRLNPELNKNP